jgi:hypothetical protein
LLMAKGDDGQDYRRSIHLIIEDISV